MYTLLTTSPPYGSQNVGDKLIEERVKEIVARERGETEFLTIFREEPLDDKLDQINASRAVLLPACPIRDTPMYPVTYQLVEDLSRIRVPLIPVGSNWNVYPGDALSRRETTYSEATLTFLRRLAAGVKRFSCREYFTCEVLHRHGITNTLMTGDPAWFLLPCLGRNMRRPARVNRVVFSPPLSAYYLKQAKQVLTMLAEMFVGAERFCAFHLFDKVSAGGKGDQAERSAALSEAVMAKNQAIREHAAEKGFIIRELAGDVKNLDFYGSCDLHVGYECHAHLNFFSQRLPSVLIAEDARGVGFNYTLGVGGFTGFKRARNAPPKRKEVTSGYATSPDEIAVAPPKDSLHLDIREFLTHEMESRFRRYAGLGRYLDEMYETRMKPFIQTLP